MSYLVRSQIVGFLAHKLISRIDLLITDKPGYISVRTYPLGQVFSLLQNSLRLDTADKNIDILFPSIY